MFYKKYRPAKVLEDFVECYFVWEGNPGKTINIESPPNALCSLVFNYQDKYRISNLKYRNRTVPICFVSGQALGNYTLHLNGKIGVVGVAFKPAAFYQFYGVPMYELTDERIRFSEICSESCQKLHDSIGAEMDNLKKIEILERYLLRILERPKYGEEAIMVSANEIFDSKGQTNISELLDKVPMSRRNFERKFLEEVGVSPKTYAKLRRFGYTCSLMAGNRDVNLMDVLHEGGYYDQSHFIKDFKYFSGRTPRKYAKTNIELANYVDGITLVEKRLQEEGAQH
jgi:AraC-like DNA-binding protein